MIKKILVVGNSNSIHLWRWCQFLKEIGFKVDILSFFKRESNYLDYSLFGNYYDFSTSFSGWPKYLKNSIFLLKVPLNLYKLIKFRSLIRNEEYCYINYHYIGDIMTAGFIYLSFGQYVLTYWGDDINIFYKDLKGLKKRFYNLVLKKSWRITYNSLPIKNLLLKDYKEIDRKKMYSIHWGVDTELFKPPSMSEKAKLRKEYDVPENSIVLLSPRSVCLNYQIKKIIVWFKENIKSDNIYLIIRVAPYSDQHYTSLCKKEAKGFRNIIFNYETLNYTDLNKFYQLADFSLHFPTGDSTAISILEGLAVGNFIVGNASLKAYQDLAKTYHLILTELEDLTEKMILQAMTHKDEMAARNRNLFIDGEHSDKRSINELKKLFSLEK